MSVKKRGYINFGAIGLSLIFLFNPNIALIDVLPDFIGYILLCLSISRLADISEKLSEALVAFKKMIFVDGAKLIAILWIFGMSVTSERNSSLLMWSFAFGVVEMIFVIPAFMKLFDGMTQLGYLYDNVSVVGERGQKSPTDKIRRLTVVFVVLKSVLSFLPELADLTSTEYYENQEIMSLYRYIGIMRFLAFVPVFIVGIIWLFRCIAYFKRVVADTAFVDALEGAYAERVLPKKGIFVRRNVALAFAVTLTAIVFSLDFRLEHVNMLPDFVSGALLMAFFVIISQRTRISKKLPTALCAVYIAVSVAAYVLELGFFDKYYYGAIYRSEEAMTAFVIMAVVSCISAVLFACLSLLVIKALGAVIDAHTGVVGVSSEENETQKKMSEDIKAELRRYLVYCTVSTLIYALTDIAYVIFAKDFGFMFIINVIGAVILAFTYVKAYLEISEAVKSKYILE